MTTCRTNEPRVEALLEETRTKRYRAIDRLFAALLLAMVAAAVASRAFPGDGPLGPANLATCFLLGVVPAAVAAVWPGRMATRHTIAAALVLFAAFASPSAAAHAEAQLPVMIAIALVAAYRDCRVMATAAAVLTVELSARGVIAPETVSGLLATGTLRVFEQLGWVLAEAGLLAWGCRRACCELRATARRQLELEDANAAVAERTGALEVALAEVEAERRRNATLVEELLAFTDSVGVPVVLVGHGGLLSHVNQSAQDSLGLRGGDSYPDAAALGLRQQDTATPVPPADDPLLAARRGERLDGPDQYLPKKDGRPARWLSARVRPMRGSHHGGVVTFNDVTERRRLEALKNEFVSTVSHELRTPLTSISGSLELIMGGVAGQVPPQARTLLEIATRNCKRLVRLIGDLLDIEKLAAGKLHLAREDLLVGPVVERAVAANLGFAAGEGVALRCETPPEPVAAYANADRVEQIVTNLVSNACKFSAAGDEVLVRLEAAPGGGARFSVQDHGPGIPADFAPRVFQPFSQADGSATRRKGGTGLGLGISKALVDTMGGTIAFETAEGQGTTFTVTLPAARAPLPTRPVAPNAPAPARFCEPQAAVLVCEADPTLSQSVAGVLAQAGFGCDAAATVDDARRLLGSRDYQAVIVEPDLPGLELVRDELARRAEPVPVLFVSSNSASLTEDEPWEGLVATVARVTESQAFRRMPRVLYVEDDPDLVQVVRQHLRRIATVVGVPTLTAATAALEHEPFDVVLLDLALPDGSGLDLLPELRRRDVPVVVFSAQEVEHGVRQRVRAALVKSDTSTERLVDVVQAALAEYHAPTVALAGC